MSTVKVTFKADLSELAEQIARQHNTPEVIEFLKDIDDHMESWDFTDAAVQVFVSRGLDLDRTDAGELPGSRQSLARVSEFLRQSEALPHVKKGEAILGVWTDPQAAYADLSLGDMRVLLELAASAIEREEKP